MTFTSGNSYSGFTLQKHTRINEIDADVYLFEHDVLKCPLLAIKNDDTNKTFSAAFNTVPTDSTGVAHILEHSVLMGSEKYPVKDVFGEINKGGLMTFLNAMTGSDITYYPFATRNIKEYFNIMDVYCDVVFNPLLDRSTFEQEGWHYHQEAEDSPLQFQGVVYNEMKGAFSDPIRLIFHHIFGGLLPGSTYAHESGGDPKNIPDLSYEKFCSFHQKHYHPSNGIFFVYGDAPLDEELNFLQEKFLAKFPNQGERCNVTIREPLTEPVNITDTYSVESDDISQKTFLAVGTGVSTVTNKEENAAFQIIANILFNSDGSPLKNAIVSSGLCRDFGGFYLASSCYNTIMVSYLVGSEPQHKDAFLSLYTETLQDMVNKTIDRDLILSELNKAEFSVREEASKAQRGLDLIGKAMTAFKYDTNPFDQLEIEELFQTIRTKALEEGYFEQLISKYLLDNPNTVTVTLVPDPQKLQNSQAEEQERLDTFAKTLDPAGLEKIITRTNELMSAQLEPNSVEKLDLLPQLTIADLNTDITSHSVTPTTMFDQKVLVSQLPTNGISYIDAGFDFSTIPQNLLPWLDLFGTIATEIGTEKFNFMSFAKEVATCTGSFSHSIAAFTKKGAEQSVRPVMWFHMKCLPEYLEQALTLVADVFRNLSLEDRSRVKEIVAREYAWAEHAAQSEGYTLAATRVFAHLSPAGRYNELINGVTSYLSVKELALDYDKFEEAFLAGLKEISRHLFNKKNLILSITAEERELKNFEKMGSCLTESLGTLDLPAEELAPLGITDHEAFITSAEVVYAVQGGTLLENGEGYNGHFEVLKTYLSRDYLWNSVRQMGGAYGCFIQFSHVTGNLAIVSYRDPQVKKTYDAYEAIPAIITSLDLPEKIMEQLIVGTYGNFDPHQSAAAQGATARNEFLSGITTEEKQQRLTDITSTTLEDLKAFAPSFSKMFQKSHRSIIGNRTKIEADKDLFTTITEL